MPLTKEIHVFKSIRAGHEAMREYGRYYDNLKRVSASNLYRGDTLEILIVSPGFWNLQGYSCHRYTSYVPLNGEAHRELKARCRLKVPE